MKRIFYFLIMLVALVSFVSAQTASAYFSETTKGNVPDFNQKGYHYGSTVTKKAGSAAYYIYSMPLGTSATNVRNAFMGKKVLLGINITTAFSDVVATLICEISGDGSNWVSFATLDADTTPDVTGVQWYLVDFTSCYAPFARLKFNPTAQSIGTSGYLQFLYAVPN